MEENENKKVIKISRANFEKNFDQAKIMRELEEKRNDNSSSITLPPIQEKEEQQIIIPTTPLNEIDSSQNLDPSQDKNNNLKSILPLLIFLIFRNRGNNR